jgi:hypothetical protein
MIVRLSEYVEIASREGWRVKRTSHGYQFFPPSGPVVTLQESHDYRARLNWRSQLKRAGLEVSSPGHKVKAS